MKNGFSVGPWTHCLPSKEGKRIEIVNNICIGPLETYIVGIENDKYFREYHIIEGLDAGETYYKELSAKEFKEALQNEIDICISYGQQEQADLIKEYMDMMKVTLKETKNDLF